MIKTLEELAELQDRLLELNVIGFGIYLGNPREGGRQIFMKDKSGEHDVLIYEDSPIFEEIMKNYIEKFEEKT